MHLRYIAADGKKKIFALGTNPITLGRSEKAGVMIDNEDMSRLHATIRMWDGDYVIKDLKSQNGTWVNDKMVDIAVLKPGDKIRLGSCDIFFEEKEPKGPNTMIKKIGAEMAGGKGYHTIMIETIKEAEKKGQSATKKHSA